MPSVYIEDAIYNYEYAKMWEANGFELTDIIGQADIIQFVGGADVNPELYGHTVHPTTHFSDVTDKLSMFLFNEAVSLGIPMVGICRGGQFLNVMCGGKMYQDVDGHATGRTHEVRDVADNAIIQCSSTHHQMMIPESRGTVLGVGGYLTNYREQHIDGEVVEDGSLLEDTEVVWYRDEKVLCFQPHPEFYNKEHECQKWYFRLINEHLEIS